MKKIPSHMPHQDFLGRIPTKYHHIAVCVLLTLSLMIFFREVVFQNKTFIAADTIAGKSFETLMKDAESQGIFPLWNPYIFCGMPGYASLSVNGPRHFDLSDLIFSYVRTLYSIIFFNNCEIGYIFLYYFLLGIGVYWLVYRKLKNTLIAFFAAFAVMHSTAYVVFIMIGHMTKVPVIAFLPYVLIILEELQYRFRVWLALALVIIVHWMLKPMHLQVIFYSFFTVGIFVVYFFVRSLLTKNSPWGVFRAAATFTIAALLAIAMTADQYFQTYEYSKYSIRGTSPLLEQTTSEKTQPASSGGLDYNYATNWSFAPSEMLTFLIPSAYGFGNYTYKGILTRNQPIRINTYFGPQPFVDSPQYMGILVFLLGVLGFWKFRKDPFIQFSAIVVVVSLLISFGKEFPFFYDLLFYYFPYFNKFRVPSMILILVQLFFPILAAYGLNWLVTAPNTLPDFQKKRWRILAYSTVGVALLSFIARDVFISIYQLIVPQASVYEKFSQAFGSNTFVLDELYRTITTMVSTDITVALVLIAVSSIALLYYWNKKVSLSFFIIIIISLTIFDLWRINEKPKEPLPKNKLQETFSTPDYVAFLQKYDTTLYRVLEFENGHPPYNNALAYWRIQNAYGYHGAKMRQIQDAFDVIGLGNPLLWGLMNVRYVISDQPDSSSLFIPLFKGQRHYVYLNRAHLPRAFFVNRYRVASALDILTNIKNLTFDPTDVAFVLEDPKLSIDPPTPAASVEYTHYGIQDLELRVKATGNNLLFLSESWYPAGWKAFIDNKELPIYRLNYMFRGIVVPPGDHLIRMVFEPQSFYIGKWISLITNIVVLGGLLFFVAQKGKQYINRRTK
ncbi:MAG: YfhO family protein [Bacteroidetes bacterium]|nr:YfhO family protein [Bacteroidota bacterium]